MKIVKLYIKNIQSISECIIDFQKEPLASESLIAITGETGAGKTTLLDGICLALFGQTSRYTKGKKLIKEEVYENLMHRGSALSRVELTFEVKNKMYQSSWEISRAYNKVGGKMKDPTTNLLFLNPQSQKWEGLGTGKNSDNLKLIEGIIGMNFDRFTRSVLLAQGDFANFLHADDKEKADLLEQLTDTSIYSSLEVLCAERNKESKTNLKLAEKSLQDVVSDLNQLEEKVGTLNEKAIDEELKNIEKQLKEKVHQCLLFDQKSSKEYEVEKLTREFVELSEQKTHFDLNVLPLLHKYKAAKPLEVPLYEYVQSEKLLKERTDKRSETQASFDTIKEKFSIAQQKLEHSKQAFEKKKIETSKQIEQISAHFIPQEKRRDESISEVKAYSNSLNELEERYKSYENEIKDSQKKRSEINTKLQYNQKVIEKFQGIFENFSREDYFETVDDLFRMREEYSKITKTLSELTEKERKLKETISALITKSTKEEDELDDLLQNEKFIQQRKDEIYQGKTEEEFAFYKTSMKLRVQDIISAQEKFISYQEEVRRIDSLEKECEALQPRIENYTIEIETLNERKASKAKDLETIQKALRQYSFASQRHLLEDGSPCPLCGSESHPYAHSTPDEEESKLLFDESNIQQEIEKSIQKIQEIERLRSREEGALEEKKKRIQEMSESLDELSNAFMAPWLRIGGKADLDDLAFQSQIADFSREVKRFTTEMDSLENLNVKAQENTNKKNPLLDKINTYKTQKAGYEAELKGISVLLDENKQRLDECKEKGFFISQKMERLWPKESFPELEVPQKKEEWIDKRKTINETQDKYRASKDLLPIMLEQKQTLDARLQALELDMENTSHHIHLKLQEKAKLEAAIKSIDEEFMLRYETTDSQVYRLKIDKSLEDSRLINQEHEQEFTTISEKYSSIKQSLSISQEEQKKAEEALLANKKSIQSLLVDYGFSNIFEVTQALNPSKSIESIQEEEKHLTLKLQSNQQQKEAIEKEIENLEKQLVEGFQKDLWDEQILTLKDVRDEYLQKKGVIRQLWEDVQSKSKLKAEVQTAFEKQKEESIKWEKMHNLLNHPSGQFKRFAQSLTLVSILYYANNHLKKLNKRYRLERDTNTKDQELALEIVDSFQADERRNVRSLSGGETFLVSLSLALGLSDLAGQRIDMKTLFIDEGFGSLDPSALDDAISALENLKSEGRTIGIISHVESLKDRIPVQIIVEKKGGGRSEVRTVVRKN